MCWSGLLYTFPQSDLNSVRFLFRPGIIFSFRTIANISLSLEKNSLFFLKKLCGRFACFLCNPNTFLCLKKKSKSFIISSEQNAGIFWRNNEAHQSWCCYLFRKDEAPHYCLRKKPRASLFLQNKMLIFFWRNNEACFLSSPGVVICSERMKCLIIASEQKSSTLSFLTR